MTWSGTNNWGQQEWDGARQYDAAGQYTEASLPSYAFGAIHTKFEDITDTFQSRTLGAITTNFEDLTASWSELSTF